MILRVAHLSGCEYEWTHHTRLGRRAGLGEDNFERIRSGPMAAGWSERERVVVEAVDALHAARDLDDEAWHRLREHLDERETIELLMLAGHYEMLATTINTLRIQPDKPRGG